MDIDRRISGKTKVVGVIGNPIEHTISPQLHNTLNLALTVDMVYVPLKVGKSDLENAIKGLKALNFAGFNVTVPFKRDVIRYLDEVSKDALLMGAVNTVKLEGGKLCGFNTDAEGFLRSFEEETGLRVKGLRVSIIGAGGTSRAIAVRLAMEGVSKLYILNRTLNKASDVCKVINESFDLAAEAFPSDNPGVEDILLESDVIINTTSVGMFPNPDEYPLPWEIAFRESQVVCDVIYNPVKTRFLSAAEQKGCKTINGLGMLIYQGIAAYEAWTGVQVPQDLAGELKDKLNTLIG